jgi:peptide/nickel transport system substrate-binding protein
LHSVLNEGFWKRQGQARVSRRRLLRGVAGLSVAGAAASLLGCSTFEEDRPVATPEGLLSRPLDTTSLARAGGTLKSVIGADVPSFDPLASGTFLTQTQIAAYTYPRLMKFAPALFPEYAKGNVDGDLVETYELSPDRLTATLRLRQGLKWDSRAPTNGRTIDAGDVVFSWNKFARFSPFRGDLAWAGDSAPGAPVESVTSPDPSTVVFKLKQVDASFLSLLAFDRLFYIMPRESEGGFDPRTETRGFGPWLMTENRPGVIRTWTRSPDYYVKGRPFIDKIEQPVIQDYASRLAQFKAGQIWSSVVSQDDILDTKRDRPDLLLRQADTFATAPSSLAFGYDNDSPWRDERLRQAASLLIDREILVDLKTDRARLEAEGLPVEVRYHSAIGAGWEGFWVDPTDLYKFGVEGKFLRFDPAEARRLLAAAGYADGLETQLHYNGGNEYAAAYTRTAELVSGMLHAGGVRARLEPHEYQNDWLPNYQFGYTPVANVGRPIKGFAGLVYRSMTSYPTLATQMYASLHRNGSRFLGMTPDGKNAQNGDGEVNQMVEQLRREFDVEKQKEQALLLARLIARKTYDIPMPPHAALGFSLTWPVIANLGIYRGWPGGSAITETAIHQWLDTSKAPLHTTTTTS